jgi:Transposase/Aldehyde dehydrogenase family
VRRKRFSVEQIAATLTQAEVGVPVADLIRQAEISEQTFYRWKAVRSAGSGPGAFRNSGQSCSAPTRMLVPRDKYELSKQLAKQTADSLVVGVPTYARTARPDRQSSPI